MRHSYRSIARNVVVAVLLGSAMIGGACLGSAPANAEAVNDMCASAAGACRISPAPVGSLCSCSGKGGPSSGRVIGNGAKAQSQQAVSNACRTYRGFCQTSTAPVGSPCACFGDSGTVTLR